MSEIVIRDAAAVDIRRITEIYNHYVRTATVTFDEVDATEADWVAKLGRIRTAGIPFLVAEDLEGELLGYALGQLWSPKSAYRYTIENSIYLAPEAAGRGVGTRLLSAFLDASREAGLRQVIAVIADEGADASLALHHRAGFVDAGHLLRTGEKFGRLIGVRFLQLELTPPAERR